MIDNDIQPTAESCIRLQYRSDIESTDEDSRKDVQILNEDTVLPILDNSRMDKNLELVH